MVKAKLITTHLGSKPDRGPVTQAKEPLPEVQPQQQFAVQSGKKPREWALATVAVGHFPQLAWLQQEWNSYSADAVERSLSKFGPTRVSTFRSSPDRLSSADAILKSRRSSGEPRETRARG